MAKWTRKGFTIPELQCNMLPFECLSCLVGPFLAETWCSGRAMAMAVRIRSQPMGTVCRLIPLNCLSQHKLLKNHQIP